MFVMLDLLYIHTGQAEIILEHSENRTYDLKAVFHFNRIVAKRSIFHCFVSTQAELLI